MEPLKYRPEIDGLRAIAVISVILYHADVHGFSGGFVGVDIFFVISGYLITSIILRDINKEAFSFILFYERRARRLLPVLFFVVFSCIPLSWMFMLPEELKDFSQSLVGVAVFASNVFFWLKSGYFEASSELKPLLHTWSLGVEEQFYLVFPLLFIFLLHFRYKIMLSVIVILTVVSFISSEFGSLHFINANFYFVFTRAWELLLGVIVALLLTKNIRRKSDILSLFGACAIGVSIIFYDENLPYPSKFTLLPVVGTLLIITFTTKQAVLYKILGNKVAVGLGLISYSAYLWHQPIFTFFKLYSNVISVIEISLMIAFTLILSMLTWKFVEVPFRQPNKINSNIIFFGSVLCTIILIVIGLLGHINSGFKDRFPRGIQTKYVPESEKQASICNYDKDYCIRGNLLSDKKLFVFGDSHADRLFETIVDNYGKKFKIYLTWDRSCFLGNPKWQPNLGSDPISCEKKREIVSELLSEKFDVIMQSQFWINEDYLFQNYNDYKKVLSEQILLMSDATEELIIVGNTPYNPTICLQKIHLGLTCDMFAEERVFKEASENLNLPQDINVKFVHPFLLHKGYDNGQSVNGKLIYIDRHHLSKYGANLLINKISTISEQLKHGLVRNTINIMD